MTCLKELVKKFTIYCSLIMVFAGAILSGSAQALVIVPARNQMPEQQQVDQEECAEQANRETRIDPDRIEPPGPYPGTASKGSVAPEGTDPEAQGIPEKPAQPSPEQLAWRKRASVYGHTKALYDRAYGLCMESRGYTVN